MFPVENRYLKVLFCLPALNSVAFILFLLHPSLLHASNLYVVPFGSQRRHTTLVPEILFNMFTYTIFILEYHKIIHYNQNNLFAIIYYLYSIESTILKKSRKDHGGESSIFNRLIHGKFNGHKKFNLIKNDVSFLIVNKVF